MNSNKVELLMRFTAKQLGLNDEDIEMSCVTGKGKYMYIYMRVDGSVVLTWSEKLS